jgi:hypothetical protein
MRAWVIDSIVEDDSGVRQEDLTRAHDASRSRGAEQTLSMDVDDDLQIVSQNSGLWGMKLVGRERDDHDERIEDLIHRHEPRSLRSSDLRK